MVAQVPSLIVRFDINYFNSSEKTLLATLMQQYIDKQIIEEHCLPASLTMTTGGGIHSDFDFLSFHRAYLEGMEDWLLLQGYPQFVPLPCWDPSTTSPVEFRVVDSDCQYACDPFCTPIYVWNPNISRPNYLTLGSTLESLMIYVILIWIRFLCLQQGIVVQMV